MPLIEGIGDEVTQFFFLVTALLVVYVAWWTTNVSERRHIRTVFLIERRSRSERAQRLTNHTQSATLVEGTTMSEPTPNVTEAPVATASSNKPPEQASTSQTAEEQEQNAIIETMDADDSVLRQRRIVFYDNRRDTLVGETGRVGETESSEDDSRPAAPVADGETPSTSNETPCRITVKLKYINDDLKLVEGDLQESLGEFKRRNFETEIAANKIIRLIFNGKVLQQDEVSLQNCGLFDNCVVHCLVHNKRQSPLDASGTSSNEDFARRNRRQRLPQMNNNNNNTGRESDLGNILFALISFILGSAWYFRYVYAHLYTVTATVALVVVTGIFSVIVIGMYFPDHEIAPPRQETNQR